MTSGRPRHPTRPISTRSAVPDDALARAIHARSSGAALPTIDDVIVLAAKRPECCRKWSVSFSSLRERRRQRRQQMVPASPASNSCATPCWALASRGWPRGPTTVATAVASRLGSSDSPRTATPVRSHGPACTPAMARHGADGRGGSGSIGVTVEPHGHAACVHYEFVPLTVDGALVPNAAALTTKTGTLGDEARARQRVEDKVLDDAAWRRWYASKAKATGQPNKTVVCVGSKRAHSVAQRLHENLEDDEEGQDTPIPPPAAAPPAPAAAPVACPCHGHHVVGCHAAPATTTTAWTTSSSTWPSTTFTSSSTATATRPHPHATAAAASATVAAEKRWGSRFNVKRESDLNACKERQQAKAAATRTDPNETEPQGLKRVRREEAAEEAKVKLAKELQGSCALTPSRPRHRPGLACACAWLTCPRCCPYSTHRMMNVHMHDVQIYKLKKATRAFCSASSASTPASGRCFTRAASTAVRHTCRRETSNPGRSWAATPSSSPLPSPPPASPDYPTCATCPTSAQRSPTLSCGSTSAHSTTCSTTPHTRRIGA